MKYKCPKCENIFEGELTSCPHCGQRFVYPKKEVKDNKPPVVTSTVPEKKVEEIKSVQKEESNAPQIKVEETKPPVIAPVNNIYMPPNNGTFYNTNNTLFVVPSQVEQEEKSRPINGVFNAFWIILVGLPSCIFSVLYGISLCVPVVGIPFGIVCFKYLHIVFKPAGREVMINYRYRPFWNSVCLIFGGLSAYLLCMLFSLLLAITVVGYPLARQWFKISKFFLAPFGARMVTINQCTENYDTSYDFAYMLANIYEDDRLVRLSDGREMLASEAIKETLTPKERLTTITKLNNYLEFNRNRKRRPRFSLLKLAGIETNIFVLLYSIMCTILAILISNAIISSYGFMDAASSTTLLVFVGLIVFIILLINGFIYNAKMIHSSKNSMNIVFKMFKERWKGILTYYPKDTPKKLLSGKAVKDISKEGVKPYQCTHTVNNMLIELLF